MYAQRFAVKPVESPVHLRYTVMCVAYKTFRRFPIDVSACRHAMLCIGRLMPVVLVLSVPLCGGRIFRGSIKMMMPLIIVLYIGRLPAWRGAVLLIGVIA